MTNLNEHFLSLAKFLSSHGVNAYLIGSSSRDFLLGKEIKDYENKAKFYNSDRQ